MKKMMFLASALVLMFATSCLSVESGSNTNSAQYKGTYTITNLESGVETKVPNVIVEITIPNSSKNLFDITFKNLSFVAGMPPQNITISGVTFTKTISESENVENYIFEEYNIVPKIGEISYDQYLISEIKGSIGIPTTMWFVCVDSVREVSYKVEFTTGESQGGNSGGDTPNEPANTDYNGKYIVTNLSSNESTEYPNVSVNIAITDEAKRLMSVTFNDLKFAPGMPALPITLLNIPYTSSEVEFSFEAHDVIPTVHGQEYAQYTISEVYGNLGSPVTIWFKLGSLPYQVEFVTE